MRTIENMQFAPTISKRIDTAPTIVQPTLSSRPRAPLEGSTRRHEQSTALQRTDGLPQKDDIVIFSVIPPRPKPEAGLFARLEEFKIPNAPSAQDSLLIPPNFDLSDLFDDEDVKKRKRRNRISIFQMLRDLFRSDNFLVKPHNNSREANRNDLRSLN